VKENEGAKGDSNAGSSSQADTTELLAGYGYLAWEP
jgi:hypothetical protein